jgi:hypothetical protein
MTGEGKPRHLYALAPIEIQLGLIMMALASADAPIVRLFVLDSEWGTGHRGATILRGYHVAGSAFDDNAARTTVH